MEGGERLLKSAAAFPDWNMAISGNTWRFHILGEVKLQFDPVPGLTVNGNVALNGSLGTIGNQPLELTAYSSRVLRLDPHFISPNVIAGHRWNAVSNGVFGATIAGGGSSDYPNWSAGEYASVLGGYGNTASGEASTALGWGTAARALGATALGVATEASGERSTASGFCSTALGRASTAGGEYSFAAGYRAKANQPGSFVWADSIGLDFASTDQSQFVIRATGGVGIGTGRPQANLHVYSDNNPAVVRVQSSGTPGFGRFDFVSDPQGSGGEWRPGYIQSTDNGGFTGGLSFVVNGTGFDNRFGEVETMRIVNGRVGIGTAAPVSALQVVGTVTETAFNPPSGRNLKENFSPVGPREVLEKVAALPITRWNFKGDAATPHVGPMAQDFHAAFSLGTDERHIATVDADGVALAAIQGLNQKLEAEVKSKAARITALEKRLATMEALLQK